MIDLGLLLFFPILLGLTSGKPERALLYWLALSPLSYNTLVVLGVDLRVISIDRLAMVASIISLAGTNELGKIFPSRLSKLEKAYALFIIVFIGEGFLQLDLRDAISQMTYSFDCYVIPFYLYFFTKYLLTRGEEYNTRLEGQMVSTLAVVGVYCALMGIFEGLTGIDLLPGSRGLRETDDGVLRANGPFWAPGVQGYYLSWILLLVLYRWRVLRLTNPESPWLRKVFTVPYTLVLAAGLYFVMFRNAWLGFLGAFSMRYLFSKRSRRGFIMVGIIAVLGVAICWTQITETGIYQKRISNLNNVYDRLGAWLYAFRAFRENPLTGIGTGNMRRYIENCRENGIHLEVMEVPATHHPHNSIIAYFAENGLLGALPMCFVIWFFLREVRGCFRLARSPEDKEFALYAVAALFAIYAPSLTDRSLEWTKSNNFMWIIFGLVAARHMAMRVAESAKAEAEAQEQSTPTGAATYA